MDVDQFIKEKRVYWKELDEISNKLQRKDTPHLSKYELQNLSTLYRTVSSDLARAKTEYNDIQLVDYLNSLLVRAYNLIYQKEPFSLRDILKFYQDEFPCIFRATLRYTGLATGVFLVFALIGYLFTINDPEFPPLLLHSSLIEAIERHKMWTHSINTIQPLASSFIMTNNISVTLTVFSLGITLGLGTFYILALNGLLLGTLSATCDLHGMTLSLWSFVLPHGVIELPCIFIAGGAGFLLGSALLIPARFPRKEMLKTKGLLAIKLIVGSLPLLVIAGIIEAFISPKPIPPTFKILLGIANGVFLFRYLFLNKRGHSSPL